MLMKRTLLSILLASSVASAAPGQVSGISYGPPGTGSGLTPIANNSILGNNTGSPATPIALTTAQVKSLLAITNSDVSGLGSAATVATGTSGATIPLLNGTNTWSGVNTFSAVPQITAGRAAITSAGLAQLDLRDSTNGGGTIKFRNTADSASHALIVVNNTPTMTLQADNVSIGDTALANTFVTASSSTIALKAANATVASVTSSGVAVTGNVTATTAITSSGTAGVGYAAGAGGTVTQLTSRTTGVTLNKPCGEITLFSTTTTASSVTTFTVTNSTVAAADVIIVDQKSGTGIYIPTISAIAAGSFNISVFSPAAVGAAEAPKLQFCAFKGAVS